MNIIWIAPPAAGKGTYSEIFKDKYGFNHISAGDVLREQVSLNTPIGKEINDIISKGEMVSDELMKRLISDKLKSLDLNVPFMLDGYPRKVNQSLDYEEVLSELNIEDPYVIFININKETGLNRILGRKNCPKCKRSYNTLSGYAKPKVENTCDYCGETLVQRSDDNKEAYEKRYDVYINETKDLIEKYRNKGKLIEIDGSKSPEENLPILENILGVNND